MHVNHPKTISTPLVCGKVVFHETGPLCQKDRRFLLYTIAGVEKEQKDRSERG